MLVASILKEKGDAVVVASPEISVADAVAVLKGRGIGVLVVTGAGDTVVGILSERDIVHAMDEAGEGLLKRPISHFMTEDVVTCTPSQSVEDLMREMTNRRIRHLPVVDGGRLAGIVSIGDLVKYRLGELQSERDALQQYIATG